MDNGGMSVDDFNVVVQAGTLTQLPSGLAIIVSGPLQNYEVVGTSTAHGAVIEVVGYQNSTGMADVRPGTQP